MLRKFSFFICFLSLFCVSTLTAGKNYKSSMPLIVLDPGHGGNDHGAKVKTPFYVEEKRLALKTCFLVRRYLEQMGYRVVMTRLSDVFVPLKERVYYANNRNCEIFVSIHFNSCSKKEVEGIEIYYCPDRKNGSPQARKLAYNVLHKSTQRTHSKSRGVKVANFCVIKETKMPSILIEGGFLTNSKELSKLRQSAYLNSLAKGVTEGIHNFFKQ
ncbi:MAG TPA: N-acetylmuramoyl-L-alanine amidase [Chlamydiales bacterium]|nr:N-acetylmuramoyl-L-alanine amidase [Chlamydiales bacterium]